MGEQGNPVWYRYPSTSKKQVPFSGLPFMVAEPNLFGFTGRLYTELALLHSGIKVYEWRDCGKLEVCQTLVQKQKVHVWSGAAFLFYQ